MKKVKDILNFDCDIKICGITDDSRNVKEGYLFVATKGFNVDHYDYIEDAISNGAVFIICDRKIDFNIPYYVVENDINLFYVECCKKYYDVDLTNITFIGITGTDGKTTTSQIISQLLENCAYVGTNGVVIGSEKYDISNTTPCISELYLNLSRVNDALCKYVVMEVSSEALLHNRIYGLVFDRIGYTNITGDHLNIHKTFDKYRNVKFTLINYASNDSIVFINGDDNNCKMINCKDVCKYGFDECNDFVIKNVNILSNYVEFKLVDKTKNIVYMIKSPLIGLYNVYNLTLAFLICLSYGYDSKYLINKIKKLQPIAGRGEILDFGQDYKIVLDYAHTYNGIYNILDTFSGYKNIIVVTGAAGGREKEKRRKIGDLLLNRANVCIFTMDDPRYEDVDSIIDDMVGDNKNYYRIIDREKAIEKAFSLADSDSVVLILGKGRDKYMYINNKKVKYCDYDVIKNYFGT